MKTTFNPIKQPNQISTGFDFTKLEKSIKEVEDFKDKTLNIIKDMHFKGLLVNFYTGWNGFHSYNPIEGPEEDHLFFVSGFEKDDVTNEVTSVKVFWKVKRFSYDEVEFADVHFSIPISYLDGDFKDKIPQLKQDFERKKIEIRNLNNAITEKLKDRKSLKNQ